MFSPSVISRVIINQQSYLIMLVIPVFNPLFMGFILYAVLSRK